MWSQPRNIFCLHLGQLCQHLDVQAGNWDFGHLLNWGETFSCSTAFPRLHSQSCSGFFGRRLGCELRGNYVTRDLLLACSVFQLLSWHVLGYERGWVRAKSEISGFALTSGYKTMSVCQIQDHPLSCWKLPVSYPGFLFLILLVKRSLMWTKLHWERYDMYLNMLTNTAFSETEFSTPALVTIKYLKCKMRTSAFVSLYILLWLITLHLSRVCPSAEANR